jgi:hypothetical protein
VRFAAILLVLSLAACNRGTQNKDAVRQGVIDHLAAVGLNVSGMTVDVTSVQFNGDHADASVSITPKNGPAGGGGMATVYTLEQKSGKWVVTGRKDAGGSPHGGGAMPPAGSSPHGQGAPAGAAPSGGSAMPSPEDLPPTKKK